MDGEGCRCASADTLRFTPNLWDVREKMGISLLYRMFVTKKIMIRQRRHTQAHSHIHRKLAHMCFIFFLRSCNLLGCVGVNLSFCPSSRLVSTAPADRRVLGGMCVCISIIYYCEETFTLNSPHTQGNVGMCVDSSREAGTQDGVYPSSLFSKWPT